MSDKYNFSIFPLFSDVVTTTILKCNTKDILKQVKKIKMRKEKTWKVKSFMSNDWNVLDSLPVLKGEIHKALHLYIKGLMKQDTRFKITGSWATKTEPKAHSNMHQHANSWLSAVYYPEGDKSFKIRFHSPKPQLWLDHCKEYNIYNSTNYDLTVQENMLVIFPSILSHEILTNQSKKTRYSIALNVIPQGTLARGSDSELTI
tara:strand:- start:318 stop:926 length:609 start_codon:yes stop_codon:yes gene_type:complete